MRALFVVVLLAGCVPSPPPCTPETCPASYQLRAEQFRNAHRGGIVFSSRRIVPGQEEPSALKTRFTLGEPCYFAIYPSAAPSRLWQPGGDGWYHAAIRVTDGSRPVGDSGDLLLFPADETPFDTALARDPDDTVTNGVVARWFVDHVSRRLAPGIHALQLDIVPLGGNRAIATAKLELVVPADRDARIATTLDNENRADQARQQAAAQAAAETARQQQERADLLARGFRHVTVTNQGDCEAYFFFPGASPEWQQRHDDWIPAGTRIKFCDGAATHCYGTSTVSNQDEQEVWARCQP